MALFRCSYRRHLCSHHNRRPHQSSVHQHTKRSANLLNRELFLRVSRCDYEPSLLLQQFLPRDISAFNYGRVSPSRQTGKLDVFGEHQTKRRFGSCFGKLIIERLSKPGKPANNS